MSRYTKAEILSKVDHTLLKPEATWPQVQTLCDEAVRYHTASVCINTCYVRQAAEYLAGRVPVCCVVGFPLGAMDTKSRVRLFVCRTALSKTGILVDKRCGIYDNKEKSRRHKGGEADAAYSAIRRRGPGFAATLPNRLMPCPP